MKKLVVMLMVVAFVSVGALSALAMGPETITLTPKMMAPVQFPHKMHQGKVGKCTICHHKGLKEPKCTSCHGVDAKAPKVKTAFHNLCVKCHKKEKMGPTKCMECHKKG